MTLRQKLIFCYKLSTCALVSFCVAVVQLPSAFAAGSTFTRDIEVVLTVQKSSSVIVTQTHTLTWDNENQLFPANKNFVYVPVYPAFASQKVALDTSVTGLTVKNEDGRTLSYKKELDNGGLQIRIPYYEDLTNRNKLVFVVTYTTSLYIKNEGGVTEISYPGLSSDFQSKEIDKTNDLTEVTRYSLTIAHDESLGEQTLISPVPSKTRKEKSVNYSLYTEKELLGKSVRLNFGTTRYIKFSLTGKAYATNASSPNFVKDILQNYVEVILPGQQDGTESANQTVYFSRISPYPQELIVDADGNTIAKLPVSATKEEEIIIEGYAVISGKRREDYEAVLANAKINQYSAELQKYTQEESLYWQVSSAEIKSVADSIGDAKGSVLTTVKNGLATVAKSLTYETQKSASLLERKGALLALSSKKGVCMEFSDLLLSVLRANKVPTRAVYGDGVGGRVDRLLEGVGHQWVGVYVPELGWVPVDPTWSDDGREYIGHDLDHFVWYVASESANSPSGFSCLSWDAKTPCRDAIEIRTETVAEVPQSVFTIKDVRAKIEIARLASQTPEGLIDNAVQYLGTSRIGRLLLSTSGLMLSAAVFLYIVVLTIVTAVGKALKRRAQNRANATTPPETSLTV
jgi:transglutaminase-like putative cysteine protease